MTDAHRHTDHPSSPDPGAGRVRVRDNSPDREPRSTSPARPRTVLATVCIPMFLVLLDVLVVNVAMPTIGHRLEVPEARWSGLVTAYTLPLAVGLLPGGWLTDRLGARRVLWIGLVGFALGSLICTVAPTWTVLLTGRAVQGLAAASMLPSSLAVLTGVWPDEPGRSRVLGIWSGVSALATALGPALGGIAVAVTSWRIVFAVNLPVSLLALLGTRTAVPRVHSRRRGTGPTRRGPLLGSTVAGALMTVVGNGVLTAVTLFLREDERIGTLPAAAALLVATAPFAALGPASGRMTARWGRRRTALVGQVSASALLAGGAALLGASPLACAVILIGVGIGLGLMTAPIVGEAMQAQPARPGVAAGLNNTARQVGTSVGVTAATVLMSTTPGSIGLGIVGATGAIIWLIAAGLVRVSFVRLDAD